MGVRWSSYVDTVSIYDKDGCIIDSSHRTKYNEDGTVNLFEWEMRKTKDYIYQDQLLPLVGQLQEDYYNGHYIIILTSDVINNIDREFLNDHGINYHLLSHRTKGDSDKCEKLKLKRLRRIFNLHWLANAKVNFYDDKAENLEMAYEFFTHECPRKFNLYNAELENKYYQEEWEKKKNAQIAE